MSKGTAKGKSPIPIIRDIKAITDEYGNVCAKAGEAQFKMRSLEADLRAHNKRLVELNMEYKAASDFLAKKEEAATVAKAEEETLTDESQPDEAPPAPEEESPVAAV